MATYSAEVERVAALLGQSENPMILALAQEHLPIVTTYVKAYTRGAGFDEFGYPAEDIEAVITAVTARYVVNPQQNVREQLGSQSVVHGKLDGFTLVEQAVLHRYRKRAA